MKRTLPWAIANARIHLPELTQRERSARFPFQRRAMRTLTQTYEELLLVHAGLRSFAKANDNE